MFSLFPIVWERANPLSMRISTISDKGAEYELLTFAGRLLDIFMFELLKIGREDSDNNIIILTLSV